MTHDKLTIENKDAAPRRVELEINTEAVPAVLRWYSAFHRGDDFQVARNNTKLVLDENGEIIE